jgi:cardiolipin synthase
VFGVTVAVATVVFKMQRFDVTYWGKLATFLLMGAIPAFVVGASTFPMHQFFTWLAYAVGIPGLVLSYWTALAYVPTIRDSLRSGRAARAGHR